MCSGPWMLHGAGSPGHRAGHSLLSSLCPTPAPMIVPSSRLTHISQHRRACWAPEPRAGLQLSVVWASLPVQNPLLSLHSVATPAATLACAPGVLGFCQGPTMSSTCLGGPVTPEIWLCHSPMTPDPLYWPYSLSRHLSSIKSSTSYRMNR